MVEREIIIYSIYFVLFVLIMLTGLILFIFQYRKAKKQEILEKEMIAQRHAKELLSTRLDIQDKTMADIGRELHDNIGQKLTLASLLTQHIEHERNYDKLEGQLKDITSMLNETLQDVREISKTMTGTTIDKNTLHQLIQNECKKVQKTLKCSIEYNNALPEEDFPINQKLVITRIIQEFLQNSLKYSDCKDIKINIFRDNKKKIITLEDNGNGFEIDKIMAEGRGIGLQNMYNRAKLIEAKLDLKSVLKEGTTLKIEL